MCKLAAGLHVNATGVVHGWLCTRGIKPVPVSPVCSWFGIGCDLSTGAVVSIDISLGVQGTLSAALGNLTSLTSLNLCSNKIVGPIPSTIGRLSGLAVLDLRNNLLTRSLPSSVGLLISLTYANFHGNKLIGSLPEWPSSLQELQLSANGFSGSVPSSLCVSNGLNQLGLYGTSFSCYAYCLSSVQILSHSPRTVRCAKPLTSK